MPQELVGVAEIAEMLGVSRQRVNQLVGSYADFPQPEAELSAGRIWSRHAVKSWMARHPERKPGQQEGRFVNFERFTDRARSVIVLAQSESNEWGHNYLGCEHLLIGLLREPEGVGGRALSSVGLTLDNVRATLEQVLGRPPLQTGMTVHAPFTSRAKHALELSVIDALDLGHNYIGTEHVLLGILRQEENLGCRIITELGVDLATLRTKVLELLGQVTVAKKRDKPAPRKSEADLAELITERFDRIEERIAKLEDRLASGQ